MNFIDSRSVILVGIFGALWGIIEMVLGAVVHTLRLPIRGVLLAAIGLGIALIGFGIIRRRGSILGMATIACLIKLFSIGGFNISALSAILIEAFLAELCLSFTGGTKRGFMTAGAVGILYTTFHLFLAQGIMFGQGIFTVYWRSLETVNALFPLSSWMAVVAFIFLMGLKVVLGIGVGWFAWDMQSELHKRLSNLYLFKMKHEE